MSNDLSRAAAVLTAGQLSTQDLSEEETVRLWARHRSSMQAATPPASAADAVDDSIALGADDGEADDGWDSQDDSSEVWFPPDEVSTSDKKRK